MVNLLELSVSMKVTTASDTVNIFDCN